MAESITRKFLATSAGYLGLGQQPSPVAA